LDLLKINIDENFSFPLETDILKQFGTSKLERTLELIVYWFQEEPNDFSLAKFICNFDFVRKFILKPSSSQSYLVLESLCYILEIDSQNPNE